VFSFCVPPPEARFLHFLGNGANKLLSYSYVGSAFVFGDIGQPKEIAKLGFSFAFQVLPTIIFIAAFFAFFITLA